MTHHSLRLHAHRYANVRTKRPIGFHAKPVYRPPLIAYALALVMWGAIWVAAWVLT